VVCPFSWHALKTIKEMTTLEKDDPVLPEMYKEEQEFRMIAIG
jgi:hypothetical protein